MSITRINEFESAQGKTEELVDCLKSLVPHISSSEACISHEALQNSENQERFVVIEKWESSESHIKSIENFPKEEMQSAMSLFGSPPDGSCYHA